MLSPLGGEDAGVVEQAVRVQALPREAGCWDLGTAGPLLIPRT